MPLPNRGRCDLLGAILVVVTCLLSVALREELGAAAVGLAISNSIQVLVFFTWVVRGVADSVSRFDAVGGDGPPH